MTQRLTRPILLALAAAALLTAPAAGQVAPPEPPVDIPGPGASNPTSADPRPQAAGEALVGTFRLAAGTCFDDAGEGEDGVDGSYFRMTQPAGQPIDNGDSPCDDQTYTPLSPGTDGGLITGSYQPHPDPAFDDDGNALSDAITTPTAFYGVDFATATNATDPQTDTEVAPPEIVAAGDGSLSGDVRAFAAAWNDQHFNQGSPKPDGEKPEGTEGPSGTYDSASGSFELEWSSRISGGPFNGFTGTWHLEGTFESSEAASTSQPSDSGDSNESSSGEVGASSTGSQAGDSTPARPNGATAGAASTGQPAHPRTGPAPGTTLAGVALFAAFAVSSILRRRVARPTR